MAGTRGYALGYRELRRGQRYSRRRQRSGKHGGTVLALGLLALSLIMYLRMTATGTVTPPAPQPKDYINEGVLTQELLEIIDSTEGTFGVFVKIPATGETLEIRSDQEFVAGSCYKLPLVLMLYEMAAAGEIDLDTKVAYTPEDRETGTGIIIGYKYGSTFTLRQLAELAVVKSDNVGANMILRRLGKERFIKYQRECGAKVIPETVNNSSPADLGLFAERLLNFCSREPQLGPELMGYFLKSEYRDRIPALLPETAKVANKIGTWPGSVNDVAIVTSGNTEYVVAVMSREIKSEKTATQTIASISLCIYNHIIDAAES